MNARLILILTLLGCKDDEDTGISEGAAEVEAHVQSFIEQSFPGELTVSVASHATVDARTDLDALGATIADSFYRIDETVEDDTTTTGTRFVQVTGDAADRDAFVDAVIAPWLVEGAEVYTLEWTWGSATVTTYAVRAPGGGSPGDTDAFFEPISSTFRRLSADPPAVTASDSYGPKRFVNGFGTFVGSYSASVECNDYYRCDGVAEATESRVGCSAYEEFEKACKEGSRNYCEGAFAFAGTCGFPDVEFESDSFKFKVSGWGWAYFTANGTISCECLECTPD